MWLQARARQVGGQPLDIVAAAPGVDDPGQAALRLEEQLGVAAIRAEKSVGSARASSSELVCRHWVWPAMAAMASTAVRATLLNTSCAASDQPEVWVWARRDSDCGSFGSNSLHQLGPEQARGALLGDLHEGVHAERSRRTTGAARTRRRQAGGDAGADVLDAVGQGVGQLQVQRRPGFLHVVAADRDRVELAASRLAV